ncbi:MAG: hypothetical protein COA99_12160, partial [Moraxellaceae bacterium]
MSEFIVKLLCVFFLASLITACGLIQSGDGNDDDDEVRELTLVGDDTSVFGDEFATAVGEGGGAFGGVGIEWESTSSDDLITKNLKVLTLDNALLSVTFVVTVDVSGTNEVYSYELLCNPDLTLPDACNDVDVHSDEVTFADTVLPNQDDSNALTLSGTLSYQDDASKDATGLSVVGPCSEDVSEPTLFSVVTTSCTGK